MDAAAQAEGADRAPGAGTVTDLPLPGGQQFGASPSFLDLLAQARAGAPPVTGSLPEGFAAPHGTTVLSLKFDDGVIIAGDRRATEGYSIADERIDKVFPADDYSAITIAGAAGQA